MMTKKIISWFVFTIVVFVFSTKWCEYKNKRELFYNDMDTRVTNIGIYIDTLNLLHNNEDKKAIATLETTLLMTASGLADDEKILGKRAEIQEAAKKTLEYSLKYDIFNGKKNLPSHIIAKQFLDSEVKSNLNHSNSD